MRQSATGDNPGGLEFETSATECDPSGIPGDECPAVEMRPLSMLLVEDDPNEKKRILSSMRKAPAEVRCVSTITAAFNLIERNWFDAIMIDRHLGGWVSAQTCRDLVLRAGDIPVVGLINEDCVLGSLWILLPPPPSGWHRGGPHGRVLQGSDGCISDATAGSAR